MKINRDTVIVLVVALLVGVASGYFFARKTVKPEVVVNDTYKIDSLLYVNNSLQDSIHKLQLKREVVYRDRIKYQNRYDTIRLETDIYLIQAGLKTIIDAPIHE